MLYNPKEKKRTETVQSLPFRYISFREESSRDSGIDESMMDTQESQDDTTHHSNQQVSFGEESSRDSGIDESLMDTQELQDDTTHHRNHHVSDR